jgi:ATP phosphoribosyltransferase-like protein
MPSSTATETGSSLRANNLRCRRHDSQQHHAFRREQEGLGRRAGSAEKMENIAMLLRGAIEARAKVGLKMNVPEAKLAEVVGFLPAEKSPTVSRLSDKDWVAVEVILEEKQERELIPRCKRAGAHRNHYLPAEQSDPLESRRARMRIPHACILAAVIAVAGCAVKARHAALTPATQTATTQPITQGDMSLG